MFSGDFLTWVPRVLTDYTVLVACHLDDEDYDFVVTLKPKSRANEGHGFLGLGVEMSG
jgi:hypothetical protein